MRRSADLEIEINKTLTFDVFQSESMALEVVVDSDEDFRELETNVRTARSADEEDVYTTMIPSTTVNMTEAAPTADPNPRLQNVDSDRTDAEIPRKRFTTQLIVDKSNK
ncbi:Oidioi.mRNA.OKI2018_I69.PAR.g11790.t1.cds [Oikopleura dioica]|uniref:Oidioi.mRNA.OKI2018_I69.PAR.g11790.t1.cds n=1 Tax=Oikopleura dioica TaxID=34765 RepID=A0ABN7S217_OIKDI|nr:Oidioi.mRNA.OKI2018_I69.PAR.g11790.t1.cds [Oikopleura dioica]